MIKPFYLLSAAGRFLSAVLLLPVAWLALVTAGCSKTTPQAAAPVNTLGGGFVYIGSSDGNLYALDALTGSQKWKALTGGPIVSSPAVTDSVFDNGVLAGIMVFAASKDGKLYAFDGRSGTPAWTFKTGAAIVSDPLLIDHTVYVASQDDNLYALDTKTGALQWTVSTHGIMGNLAASGQIIYFSSADGNLYAISAVDGTPSGTFTLAAGVSPSSGPSLFNGIIYVGGSDKRFYALYAGSGAGIWNEPIGGTSYNTATTPVYNDLLFVAAADSSLYAIDDGGTTDWSIQLQLAGSCPTVVNDVLYVGDHDGYLDAVAANTGGGLLWASRTGGPIAASPAVANALVYVGSADGKFYAFKISGGALQWSAPTGGAILSSPSIVDAAGIIYRPFFSGDR